jgi:hypothetical protein
MQTRPDAVSVATIKGSSISASVRASKRSCRIHTLSRGHRTPAVGNTATSAPARQAVAKPNPTRQVIRYAAAVLKGQANMLESVAPCFVSNSARIRKHEEGWMLEWSEFASCTTGEQVFPIADSSRGATRWRDGLWGLIFGQPRPLTIGWPDFFGSPKTSDQQRLGWPVREGTRPRGDLPTPPSR